MKRHKNLSQNDIEIIETREIHDFINMCKDAYDQGWHESNGGNASHRLTTQTVEKIKDRFNRGDHYEMTIDARNVGGEYFIITGSGQQMRNVKRYPTEVIGIIRIDDDGKGYTLVWGLTSGANPTMETATHLLTHNVSKVRGNRTLLHSHPIAINTLTFLLKQDSKVYTRALWSMITECSVVFPEGVSVIDWMVCGSDEIGIASAREMEKCNVVIWPHHGIFAISETPDLAFGLLHTIEKAAGLYLNALQAGGIKQSIGHAEVEALSQKFGFEYDQSIFE